MSTTKESFPGCSPQFARITNDLFDRDLELTGPERLVIMALVRGNAHQAWCFYSYRHLEQRTGLSRDTVQRALKSLISRGFVAVQVKQQGKRASHSHSILTAFWKALGAAPLHPEPDRTFEGKGHREQLTQQDQDWGPPDDDAVTPPAPVVVAPVQTPVEPPPVVEAPAAPSANDDQEEAVIKAQLDAVRARKAAAAATIQAPPAHPRIANLPAWEAGDNDVAGVRLKLGNWFHLPQHLADAVPADVIKEAVTAARTANLKAKPNPTDVREHAWYLAAAESLLKTLLVQSREAIPSYLRWYTRFNSAHWHKDIVRLTDNQILSIVPAGLDSASSMISAIADHITGRTQTANGNISNYDAAKASP